MKVKDQSQRVSDDWKREQELFHLIPVFQIEAAAGCSEFLRHVYSQQQGQGCVSLPAITCTRRTVQRGVLMLQRSVAGRPNARAALALPAREAVCAATVSNAIP